MSFQKRRVNVTEELANLLLERPLGEYVAEKRDDGRSWRLIARDLLEDTDGKVDLTDQTLRNWFGKAAA